MYSLDNDSIEEISESINDSFEHINRELEKIIKDIREDREKINVLIGSLINFK